MPPRAPLQVHAMVVGWEEFLAVELLGYVLLVLGARSMSNGPSWEARRARRASPVASPLLALGCTPLSRGATELLGSLPRTVPWP